MRRINRIGVFMSVIPGQHQVVAVGFEWQYEWNNTAAGLGSAIVHKCCIIFRGAHCKARHFGGECAAHIFVIEVEDFNSFAGKRVFPRLQNIACGKVGEVAGFSAANDHVAILVNPRLHAACASVTK